MPIRIGQRPDHGFDEPLGLLSDCHRRIEHFLKVLVLVTDHGGGRALADGERQALEGALAYFATAAPRHTADEENSLFPRLRASGDAAAHASLRVLERLERDHAEAETDHHRIDALVRRWIAEGRLAQQDVTELRTRLDALQTMYERHIAVEDRELFPEAGRTLSADDLQEIGREMAARRRQT